MSNRSNLFSDLVITVIALAAVIGVVLGIGAVFSYLPRNSTQQQIVQICNKEAVTANKKNQYRIYTSNGVFVVEDYWPMIGLSDGSRFDSADFYQRIKVGEVYTLTAYGWRNGFFSWFPNITSLTPSQAPPVGTC